MTFFQLRLRFETDDDYFSKRLERDQRSSLATLEAKVAGLKSGSMETGRKLRRRNPSSRRVMVMNLPTKTWGLRLSALEASVKV